MKKAILLTLLAAAMTILTGQENPQKYHHLLPIPHDTTVKRSWPLWRPPIEFDSIITYQSVVQFDTFAGGKYHRISLMISPGETLQILGDTMMLVKSVMRRLSYYMMQRTVLVSTDGRDTIYMWPGDTLRFESKKVDPGFRFGNLLTQH